MDVEHAGSWVRFRSARLEIDCEDLSLFKGGQSVGHGPACIPMLVLRRRVLRQRSVNVKEIHRTRDIPVYPRAISAHETLAPVA
jgi:hypothetical protein